MILYMIYNFGMFKLHGGVKDAASFYWMVFQVGERGSKSWRCTERDCSFAWRCSGNSPCLRIQKDTVGSLKLIFIKSLFVYCKCALLIIIDYSIVHS